MTATVEKMRGPERTEQVTVRLTAAEKDALRQIALRRGLHMEQAVRQWIYTESERDGGSEAA